MTPHQLADWLRGRAKAHKRAAQTYARTARPTDAEIARGVARELTDLADELVAAEEAGIL